MSTAVIEQEEQLVAFRLAGETYAIPIALVHEIIRPSEITVIPRTSEFIKGVINLRGKVIPVLDLRVRLEMPPITETRSTRIVVVEVEQGIIGMMVDSVSEVLRLPTSQIEPPSDLVTCVEKDLIRGIGKKEDDLIILLDISKTLHVE